MDFYGGAPGAYGDPFAAAAYPNIRAQMHDIIFGPARVPRCRLPGLLERRSGRQQGSSVRLLRR
jgi:hypothetical protein